ncbi:MAG: M1 family peptidase [Sphingobacteriia bacterium]|nr:M1 family peptidase [Sphingobacteriia bacterium]
MKFLLGSLGFVLFFSSCLHLGVNLNHHTPKKAAKTPAFTRKDSLLGASYSRRTCFDVHHYGLNLSIDPLNKTIAGQVKTSFWLLEPVDQIQLDLDPVLTIDSISDGNRPLNFQREGTAVIIALLSQEKAQALTIYYHGAPHIARRAPWDGGLIWKKDKDGNPWAGVACEGDGAQLWLPVKMLLADEPDSADLQFTVPKGLSVVSNGVLVDKRSDDKTSSFHWKTRYPINVYNLTFYLGNYQLQERDYLSSSGKRLQQQFWVLPQHATSVPRVFQYTDTLLNFYEKLYGDYPWQGETYKLIESPYEGMEHQTAIAYGSGFEQVINPKFNYILVHETAHEWWGNSVSVSDFSEVWIHEGFATYTEALYNEYKWGRESYLQYMNGIYYSILNRKPVIGPDQVHYWDYKDGDVYMKGAAALHALRCVLSDDPLFFKLLREFYQQHKMGQATTQQFIELSNTMSGRKLNFVFDQYLYQRSSPKLVWTISAINDSNEVDFLYRFENIVPGFAVPIEIKVGEKAFTIYPDRTNQLLRLPAGSKDLLQINVQRIYLQKVHLKLNKFKKS